MKKVISVLLILIFVLSGCSQTKNVPVEKFDWEFSRIAVTKTGEVVFCSEYNKPKFENAKVSDFDLSADKGIITITNAETSESWTLEYEENKTAQTTNTEGSIYNVFYNSEDKNLKGYATTAIAAKNDVSFDYYLIITIGGYDLYFIDYSE